VARRQLNLAGAGLVTGLAAWTAVNRVLVRRVSQGDDPVGWPDLNLPEDVRGHTFTMSDGWVLRGVERGPKDGRPVLLLHGLTLGAAVWPYQLARLADEGFRVIALDLRGHGLSGGRAEGPAPPPSGSAPTEVGADADLTLDRMAVDVSEVMSALELENVTLVGHSMGGMIALRLLGSDPVLAAGGGPVRRLLLAATAANITRRRGFPGLADAVAVAQPLVSSASGLAARLPGPTLPAHDLAFLLARITFGPDSSARQVSFTGQLTSSVPVRVSAALLAEILRFDAEDVLASIRIPTTVVVGNHDLMTPETQAEYMARHIAGAELVVLKGCGHMLMLERPDDLNALIAGGARP
jgi:pimeloyl-ACP methyl ester carboxylesterase